MVQVAKQSQKMKNSQRLLCRMTVSNKFDPFRKNASVIIVGVILSLARLTASSRPMKLLFKSIKY